jgi:hypothetical protein
MAKELNIPHLTGGYDDWQDVLTADNMSDQVTRFRLVLYRDGVQSVSEDYFISPYSSLTIKTKDLDSSADCGVILTDDSSEMSCSRYRIAYRSPKGGVAEFALDNLNKSQLSFNFSNTFTDIVQWKGIAIMNSGFKPQNVTLYALGKGKVLGVASDSIAPRSKILGPHTLWFPDVDLNSIESIVVTSLNAALTGVTISGNYDSSKLLFTSASQVNSFKDLNKPSLQLAKRIIGSWSFVEVTDTSSYQQSFLFARVAGFDSQNKLYELKTVPFWGLIENVKAYYNVSQKYYSLSFNAANDKTYTKVYRFTFIDDYRVQGAVALYDDQGKLVGSANLFGHFGGAVDNNNADEDLSLDLRTSSQSDASLFLNPQ